MSASDNVIHISDFLNQQSWNDPSNKTLIDEINAVISTETILNIADTIVNSSPKK